MSQRVVVECDACLAEGKKRSAATVGVRALSVEVEVDLCDVHVKPLVEMVERLVELGRTPNGKAAPQVEASLETLGHPCPECGRVFAGTQGLGAHRRLAHGVEGGSNRTAARRRAKASPGGSPSGG
jgi:hypothetical protein